MKEQELIARAKQQDPKAMTEIIEMYSPRIYNMALRMMGNEQDAEDVLQETFLTVINKLHQFQGNSSIYTWIYRIAMNFALGKLRKVSKTSADQSISDPDFDKIYGKKISEWPELSPETLTSKEFHDMIEEAVHSLPDIYRIVFILRDLQGLSTDETARILNISISNVKIRLMRARNFLREKLDPKIREYEII